MKSLKNLKEMNFRNNKWQEKFNLREIILIGSLLLIALLYIYLELLIFPLSAEINDKQSESTMLTEELDQMRMTANQLPQLEENYDGLKNELEEQEESFYPSNKQEFFINTLEDIAFNETNLSVPSINFSETSIAEEYSEGLYRTEITFDYVSDYDSIKDLISLLEKKEEKVKITSLIMTEESVDQQYSGTIALEFYSVPREFDYEWPVEILEPDDERVINQNIFHRDRELWAHINSEEQLEDNTSQPTSSSQDFTGTEDNNTTNAGKISPSSNQTSSDHSESVVHVAEEGETFEDLSLLYYGKPDYGIFLRELNAYDENEILDEGSEIDIPSVIYLRDK
ncbi:hypothetical protein SAMN05421734_103143 [Pelagirhabdus alkalitolerans]|uniref:Type IV pilus assembly protein PilO n=1 Tax=Pelagirhabdus alkalitolerans TaxID=1612202 RepID=A0A1G6HNT9_9BACI|nr:hypothetical protein [Pelagirhabdus alkalitolerans]SDB95854.1 hypothetical protein SAMN05421734_103143 [Pelagirhabdus alkalitolerans]